jgi:hypothetical protein
LNPQMADYRSAAVPLSHSCAEIFYRVLCSTLEKLKSTNGNSDKAKIHSCIYCSSSHRRRALTLLELSRSSDEVPPIHNACISPPAVESKFASLLRRGGFVLEQKLLSNSEIETLSDMHLNSIDIQDASAPSRRIDRVSVIVSRSFSLPFQTLFAGMMCAESSVAIFASISSKLHGSKL